MGNKVSECKLDLISRTDAINAVCDDCTLERKDKCKTDGYCYEVKNLMALPSTEAEWIPVSERMPKENERYLVQMSYGIMRVLSWANNLEEVDEFDFYNEKHGGWYELDSEWGYCERNGVIAWMPLPKPYGEDDE